MGRQIKASEFKAKCLALMDEVARTGRSVVITKNGKPVAGRYCLADRRRVGRAQVIVLNTHVAVWLVTDDRKLGARSRALAMAGLLDGRLAVSAISFWEIALQIAKNRLRSVDKPSDVRRQILDTGLVELPLTGDICLLAVELEHLHSDRRIASVPPAPSRTMLRWLLPIGRYCDGDTN